MVIRRCSILLCWNLHLYRWPAPFTRDRIQLVCIVVPMVYMYTTPPALNGVASCRLLKWMDKDFEPSILNQTPLGYVFFFDNADIYKSVSRNVYVLTNIIELIYFNKHGIIKVNTFPRVDLHGSFCQFIIHIAEINQLSKWATNKSCFPGFPFLTCPMWISHIRLPIFSKCCGGVKTGISEVGLG